MVNMVNAEGRAAKRWYREPWPWLLMTGPVIVIIAGFATAWLAVRSSDGLVAEDYYKQGLAAGETLGRSKRAEEMGVSAALRLTGDRVAIRLGMRSATDADVPPALLLTLSHPTRAGIDQKARLQKMEESYVGELNLPASGHWLVLVEDEARTWRVMASVMLPAAGEVVIGATEAAGKG